MLQGQEQDRHAVNLASWALHWSAYRSSQLPLQQCPSTPAAEIHTVQLPASYTLQLWDIAITIA